MRNNFLSKVLVILTLMVSVLVKGSENIKFIKVNWSIEWKKNDLLNNPYYPTLYKDKLFIYDVSGEKPIVVCDTSGTFLFFIGEWGKGPGECSKESIVRIGGVENNKLYIFDDGKRAVIIFDAETGAFEKELDVSYISSPQFVCVSRNRLFFAEGNFEPWFLRVVDLSPDGDIIRNPIQWGSYNQIPELSYAKRNYLLKQCRICADTEGNIYAALKRGSLLVAFSSKGKLLFKTLSPYQIKLPDFVTISPSYPLMSPPVTRYPIVYTSIDVDDKYLYVIYSGFQAKPIGADLESMFDNHDIDSGKIMTIFSKQTGQYLFSVELPIAVRGLSINRNSIYVVSVIPKIALVKFAKPDELR